MANPELRLDEARAALRAGNLAEARRLAEKVLRRDRRAVAAVQILGAAAAAANDWDGAERYAAQSVRLRPRDPMLLTQLARVRRERDDYHGALAAFERALAVDPDYAPALRARADLLEVMGRFDEARAALRGRVEAGREDAEMAVVFARLLRPAGRSDEMTALLRRHVDAPGTAPPVRRQILFMLGEQHEKAGETADAWACYERANALGAAPFDRVSFARAIDRLTSVFSKSNMAALARSGLDGSQAVFVVGLPRSGSTLIEQILDAHPEAHGAGELSAMDDLASTLVLRLGAAYPYPICVASLTEQAAGRLGGEYLERLAALAPGASLVVDKLLVNYQHLGLIALLLPRARVIHAERDPLDLCFSCWATNLIPANHRYASSLADLGFVHRHYRRLMAHWGDVLDLPRLDVCYERLVAEPEDTSRRLVEFCGLPWDDRCLRFHESGRVVRTLSYDQVRRPVYGSSVGRHRPFADRLDELRAELDAPD